jgi:hypothetical protein
MTLLVTILAPGTLITIREVHETPLSVPVPQIFHSQTTYGTWSNMGRSNLSDALDEVIRLVTGVAMTGQMALIEFPAADATYEAVLVGPSISCQNNTDLAVRLKAELAWSEDESSLHTEYSFLSWSSENPTTIPTILIGDEAGIEDSSGNISRLYIAKFVPQQTPYLLDCIW